jgi:hypothetical protein
MGKVSFDCSGKDFSEDEWGELMKRLETRLQEAALPSLYSDRWDDTECGCTLEGTLEEVGRVREILSGFSLRITCE